MGALRRERPEVPLHVVRANARVRQPLLRVDEVGELDRVADEEHGRVVADEVVVPLFGVELEREATRVAHRVGTAELAGDGRDAREHRRALADMGQEGRARPLRHVLGHLEEAVRPGALGMDDALGHALAVEVLHPLDRVGVVQNGRALRADGQRMVVAGGRDAGVVRGGRRLLVAHWETSSGTASGWRERTSARYPSAASSAPAIGPTM